MRRENAFPLRAQQNAAEYNSTMYCTLLLTYSVLAGHLVFRGIHSHVFNSLLYCVLFVSLFLHTIWIYMHSVSFETFVFSLYVKYTPKTSCPSFTASKKWQSSF